MQCNTLKKKKWGVKTKKQDFKKQYTIFKEQYASIDTTKKSYISRIENGHTDIQLSTLFRIFQGLGRKVSFTIL